MRDLVKIFTFSKELWRYYATVAAFVLVLSVLNLVNPYLTKAIVDGAVKVTGGQNVSLSYFFGIVILMFISATIVTILTNINGYIGDMMATKLNNLLSRRYFEHLLKLPISYFDNEITGKITGRLERSISTVSSLIQTFSNNFFQFFNGINIRAIKILIEKHI